MTQKNQHLLQMKSDFLYHLGITISDIHDTRTIEQQFGDVRFVCMGGTKARMEAMTKHLQDVIGVENIDDELVDLCAAAKRFAVFKVGPVLCCSHGIGMSSMSVLLHELIKLVRYARCPDPIFIRIGTSGGLGIPPGTVVVTKNAFNGYLQNEHEIAILGKRVVRPAQFDRSVLEDIVKCGFITDDFSIIVGNTMAAECFYEGQGRLDGACCDYSQKQKLDFLQKCYEHGIRNIEMEATMFSSLTLHSGVRAADICVTILDRLEGDQVNASKEQRLEFEKRPLIVVGRYIKHVLSL